MTTTTTILYPDDKAVSDGLEFILAHFSHQICLWPRTISTKTSGGKQIVVYSKQEAIARFKQANYLDCRINAYPKSKCIGAAANALAPNFIMIDLDACNFDNDDILNRVLKQTIARIKSILQLSRSAKLTVIYSGNGYHIYIPIDAIVLEQYKEFSYVDNACTKFIRFAEWYLSDGKSDHSHNTTVSPNNCMLRVPGSINSKNDDYMQVTIINKFNDKLPLPKMNLVMGSFLSHLKEKGMELNNATIATTRVSNYNEQRASTSISNDANNIYYYWIEKLLQVPLPDYRRNCIWRILAPYLINVQNLSYDESFNIIANWLDKCSKLKGLRFNAKSKIRCDLNNAIRTGYNPVGLVKLNSIDKEFYKFLEHYGIINK